MEDTEGMVLIALHHSPYFEKSLQVVNLSERHRHQNQSFEERPQHHSAVCVVVDWREKRRQFVKLHTEINFINCLSIHVLSGPGLTRSVYPLADLHVLLLVLYSCHGDCQLVDHLLQLVLVG